MHVLILKSSLRIEPEVSETFFSISLERFHYFCAQDTLLKEYLKCHKIFILAQLPSPSSVVIVNQIISLPYENYMVLSLQLLKK